MARPEREVAVIVLGAKLLRSGLPNSVGRARMERGVELFRAAHPRCRLFICGGPASGPLSEAEAFRDYGLGYASDRYGQGFSQSLDESILLECESLSTLENARAATRMMIQSGLREALLVTDPLHILRAWILFRQSFRARGLKVRPAPAWGVLRRFVARGNYKAAAKWAGREALALIKLFVYDLPAGLCKKSGG